MHYPAPWTDIGGHEMLPRAMHDEVARFNSIAHLNLFLAQRVVPKVRTAYERRAKVSYRLRHGKDPGDRREVDEAIRRDPAYRAWSALRRNAMPLCHHCPSLCFKAMRTTRALADRQNALLSFPSALSSPVPRYMPSVRVVCNPCLL
jgi:hypothetical protein